MNNPTQAPSKKLSSGPWKVAIGSEQAMENWLVARTGHSIEHNDEVIYITTDHVHASMAESYPFEDAEFIVRCRNYELEHGDPIERIEHLQRELRKISDAGYSPAELKHIVAAVLDGFEVSPTHEPPAGPPWAFDRYQQGRLMAQGIVVERETTFEAAALKASRMADRLDVLVLRHPSPPPRARPLNASERLHNICDALSEQADESPFTREEWERVDKQTVALQKSLREAIDLAQIGDITEETEAHGWGAWLKEARSVLGSSPTKGDNHG